jgi:hypothetical protein
MLAGCSQQLYKCAQTRWTGRLVAQMMLYVLFLALSMGTGGMMPWILQRTLGHVPLHGAASSSPALQRFYRDEPGYSYNNSNTYSYCKETAAVGGKEQLPAAIFAVGADTLSKTVM